MSRRGKPRRVTCHFCYAPIMRRVVTVSDRRAPVEKRVRLWIDVNPHPNGKVIQLSDGTWKMLRDRSLVREGVDARRSHSARECAAIGGDPDHEESLLASLIRKELGKQLDRVLSA